MHPEMDCCDARSCDALVSLRLESGSISFVCGKDALLVPPQRAQRCELIADLREESDEYKNDLAVPISLAEARAWLAFSAQAHTGDVGEAVEADNGMFLQALKV